MSEKPKFPDQLKIAAQQRLDRIVGYPNPFQFIDAPSGDSPLTTRVFRCRYTRSTTPPGSLGQWTDNSAVPGRWLQEPQEGQEVLIKTLNPSYVTAAIEQQALMKLNDLFSPEDTVRHSQLYGYGNTETTLGGYTGYLVTEFISDPFRQLGKYFEINRTLPLEECVSLSLALTTMLVTMHRAKIAHNDLDGQGLLDHIFWNTDDVSLRVIDWGNASVSRTELPMRGHNYTTDRGAIGHIFIQGLTGEKWASVPPFPDYEPLINERTDIPIHIREMIITIIKLSRGIRKEKPSDYPKSAQGTVQLAEDLKRLQHALADQTE